MKTHLSIRLKSARIMCLLNLCWGCDKLRRQDSETCQTEVAVRLVSQPCRLLESALTQDAFGDVVQKSKGLVSLLAALVDQVCIDVLHSLCSSLIQAWIRLCNISLR